MLTLPFTDCRPGFCFPQSFVCINVVFFPVFSCIHFSCSGLPDSLQCSNHVGSIPPGQSDWHHLRYRDGHGDNDCLPDIIMYHADGSVPEWCGSQRCQSLPHADLRWAEETQASHTPRRSRPCAHTHGAKHKLTDVWVSEQKYPERLGNMFISVLIPSCFCVLNMKPESSKLESGWTDNSTVNNYF